MVNSFIIAVGATMIVLGVGVPAAYWLSHVRSGLAPALLLIPVFLQMVPAASSVIPLFPVLASWGLIGTLAAVIIATAAMLLPWALILMGPFFATVPWEPSEAASVDGAGSIRQFVAIVVPLAMNGVITVGILTTYLSAFFTDWPGMMPASVMTAVPIMMALLVFQRRLSEGLSAGAVRG